MIGHARVVLSSKRTGEVTFEGAAASKRRPCPICGKPDWCLVDDARGKAICPRVPSPIQIKTAGWLHVYGPDTSASMVRVARAESFEPPPDFSGEARDMEDECEPEFRRRVAESLGVSVESLFSLGMGQLGADISAFPMRDGKGNVIGIRFRCSKDGRKWAAKGSRNGLFYCRENIRLPGMLYIVEGPTSCAAVMTAGRAVVGRPSCSAGDDMTAELVGRRDVTIIADNDKPDAYGRRAGLCGAEKLAAKLRRTASSVRIVTLPGVKDAREWLQRGRMTGAALDCLSMANTEWKPSMAQEGRTVAIAKVVEW